MTARAAVPTQKPQQLGALCPPQVCHPDQITCPRCGGFIRGRAVDGISVLDCHRTVKRTGHCDTYLVVAVDEDLDSATVFAFTREGVDHYVQTIRDLRRQARRVFTSGGLAVLARAPG